MNPMRSFGDIFYMFIGIKRFVEIIIMMIMCYRYKKDFILPKGLKKVWNNCCNMEYKNRNANNNHELLRNLCSIKRNREYTHEMKGLILLILLI